MNSINNIRNNYNLNLNNYYGATNTNTAKTTYSQQTENNHYEPQHASVNFNNFSGYIPSFNGFLFNNSLSTQDKKKYNEIAAAIEPQAQKELKELLNSGKLLDKSANDSSTTLDNLHKILTNPRIEGLDKQVILQDVISTIHYPFIITQKFGDIPNEKIKEVIETEQKQGKTLKYSELNVISSTCPAASIEFNLAHKMPSEFARMAESLSSKEMCVKKTINVNELSQGIINTMWMLNEFGTEHKMIDWNTLNVTLRPDKNAIMRAKIQNSFKDPGERSVVDVLMQSTFMNTAAQNSYDSITDKRIPKYNDDDTGLIDIEKNFIEELVTGKGKVCVTYQRLNDDGKLIGYECEQNETLEHIQDTINNGENVIIGYTFCDEDKNVIGGHEITIIGIEKDKKGNQYFVCNDTDDGVTKSIRYPVKEFLPKIHHAGIPRKVLGNNVEFVEPWKELLQIYKETKQQESLNKIMNKSKKLTVLSNN